MQNFTVRERLILVAVILTFLIGAGHRYWEVRDPTPTDKIYTNNAKN